VERVSLSAQCKKQKKHFFIYNYNTPNLHFTLAIFRRTNTKFWELKHPADFINASSLT
jgi:hypothetical protein